jgi:hypothetical protein
MHLLVNCHETCPNFGLFPVGTPMRQGSTVTAKFIYLAEDRADRRNRRVPMQGSEPNGSGYVRRIKTEPFPVPRRVPAQQGFEDECYVVTQ